jgi:membrane fusion protein, multidrug efflux system
LKTTIWALAIFGGLGLLALPKLTPLFHAKAADRPAVLATTTHGGSASSNTPLRVSAHTVRSAKLAETLSATGTLLAEEGVELQAETNGKVIAIRFTEGARVRKGDLLVKLNDADLIATHARAKYRKQLAVLRERRIAQLLKQGVARQEEYDTALNELNVQDAEIDLTQAQIAKTEIRAPFDGVVGLRYVSEGSFVNAATRIATLQRLDSIFRFLRSTPRASVSAVRLSLPLRAPTGNSQVKSMRSTRASILRPVRC